MYNLIYHTISYNIFVFRSRAGWRPPAAILMPAQPSCGSDKSWAARLRLAFVSSIWMIVCLLFVYALAISVCCLFAYLQSG